MNETNPPPSRDPFVGAMRDQADAIELFGDAMGEVARDVAHVKNTIEAAITGFAAQHGNREAAEVAAAQARVKVQQTLDAILHEVRKLGQRVTAVEGEVDELKAARIVGGANGHGSGEATD